MKFSVLMSIYYKECPAFFNEAMISIWDQQTLKPSEIILVEDGELSLELYNIINFWEKKISNTILKVIKLNKNVGLGKALNEGIKHCSFNLIARMDSDDVSVSNRFEKQIECFSRNSSLALLGTQVSVFLGDVGNLTGQRVVPCSHNDIVKFSKFRCPFTHPTIMFKKDLIESLGGYKHHMFMEDYNLFLRIIASKSVTQNLEEILVLVRSGSDFLSRRRGLNYIKSEWQLAKLKDNINIQSKLGAYSVFVMRALPRLLPSKLIPFVYSFLHR